MLKKLSLTLAIILIASALCLGAGVSKTQPTTKKVQPTPVVKTTQTNKTVQPTKPPFKDQKEKLSYSIGLDIGKNLKKQEIDVDPKLLIKGLTDGLSGAKPLLTEDEIKEVFTAFQKEMQTKQLEKQKKLAEKNQQEGEAYLAANKSKEGVITLPSGLQYKELTAGTGATPTANDTVNVNYRGSLVDGTEFDSSYKRGQPLKIPVTGVIPGWTEALQMMKVGAKWQVFIPANLAYGEQGAGQVIGPNAVLIFEMELLGIEPQATPIPNPTPTPEVK